MSANNNNCQSSSTFAVAIPHDSSQSSLQDGVPSRFSVGMLGRDGDAVVFPGGGGSLNALSEGKTVLDILEEALSVVENLGILQDATS
jgi:hypothetical protein